MASFASGYPRLGIAHQYSSSSGAIQPVSCLGPITLVHCHSCPCLSCCSLQGLGQALSPFRGIDALSVSGHAAQRWAAARSTYEGRMAWVEGAISERLRGLLHSLLMTPQAAAAGNADGSKSAAGLQPHQVRHTRAQLTRQQCHGSHSPGWAS